MPVVIAAFTLAAAIWGAICTRRVSLLVGSGVLLAVGYTLGHEFWNAKFGPVPVTLDRLLLMGLIAAFAYRLRFGRIQIRALTGTDAMLALMLVIFSVSALLSGQTEITDGVTSKWGRLVTSFWIPAFLYGMIRQLEITRRDWSRLLIAFVVLGFYLAATSVFEISSQWSLVFPRYIANPDLGIHFGRARGPELNSVSLGLYLTACFLCSWTLLNLATKRIYQLLLLIVLPLTVGGVYFTYTRSTYIGLAASGLVVTAFYIPKRWRMPAMAGAAVLGSLVMIASWSQLLGIKREGTVEDSEHSVTQRQSFAYVSWQMFRDNPVLGVGFGRFYDRKLRYLSDRSQNFELESLRPLHHHNTLLSVLTETGIVGFAAFVGLIVSWSRCSLRLATSATSSWHRAQGVLLLALLTNYLTSAVFHDLTLLPSQELLLFVFAAVTVNLSQREFVAETALMFGSGRLSTSQTKRASTIAMTGMEQHIRIEPAIDHQHIELLGMRVSQRTMQQTIGTILDWCRAPHAAGARFVVTPNVDHAVLFHQREDMRAAYSDASLVLADGTPLVWAAKLLKQPLPERVAGSDLVPQLFESATHPLRVFLLGAAPGVAEQAALNVEERWTQVNVVGTYSPPLGFENDSAENDRVLSIVNELKPDLVIVGFGAPKQELWVHRHHRQMLAKVVICAGATIDFLAGHRRRSPVWMRRVGLEWVHRLYTEPRRLAGRYLRDAWIFPQLVWHQWRNARV